MVDLGGVSQNLDNLLREAATAKRQILLDSANYFVKQAQKYAHVITGRTKGSIHISPSFSSNAISIESAYGAPFEEARGSPHDFMTQASEDLIIQMRQIIEQRYKTIMQGGQIR